MRFLFCIYPSLVGLLLGLLQTGLYFQLSFTLSSSFATFLLITVCWLLGSVTGTLLAQKVRMGLNGFLLLGLLTYYACALLLQAAPFNTQFWVVYAALILLSGIYPGVFFVRLGAYYSAGELFFKENNGFILGLIAGTLLFMIVGRSVLWLLPVLVAALLVLCSRRFAALRADPSVVTGTRS
jgi:hypothetical protein